MFTTMLDNTLKSNAIITRNGKFLSTVVQIRLQNKGLIWKAAHHPTSMALKVHLENGPFEKSQSLAIAKSLLQHIQNPATLRKINRESVDGYVEFIGHRAEVRYGVLLIGVERM